jgi:hypothetical protein
MQDGSTRAEIRVEMVCLCICQVYSHMFLAMPLSHFIVSTAPVGAVARRRQSDVHAY